MRWVIPIYVFECPKCKTTIELSCSIHDESSPMCCEENCNIEMVRIISASSFHLKGLGWAAEGYSKSGVG